MSDQTTSAKDGKDEAATPTPAQADSTPKQEPAAKPVEPQQPAAPEEDKPAAQPDSAALAADSKAADEKAPEADGKEAGAETKADAEADKKKARRNLWGMLADILLVVLLLAVLAVGGLYLQNQKEKYHIPTPMEQAMQENNELTAEIIALTQEYKDAQKLLALNSECRVLQNKISDKQAELTAENNACSETVSNIEAANRRILALQHQIRSVDASNRQIAYNSLTGMNIGDITTTTGKAYRSATVTFLDKKFIGIRTPNGASRFPVKQLVKENLPDFVLYAFGKLDLVDMSDFDTADGSTARKTKTRVKTPAKDAPKRQSSNKNKDYDPASGKPVVDTRTDDPTIVAPADDEPEPEGTDDGLEPL